MRAGALTEVHGTWTGNPTSYVYQWDRCDAAGGACESIAGATAQTYTLTAEDVGHVIRVQETAINDAGAGSPATSAGTGAVSGSATPPPPPPPPPSGGATRPSVKARPAIIGSAILGDVVSASTGTWSGANPKSYTVQWQRCRRTCTNIRGATRGTYRVTRADRGARLRILVTARNRLGRVRTASAEFGPVMTLRAAMAKVQSELVRALKAHGSAARIGAVLGNDGYALPFTTPAAGRLRLAWWYVPGNAARVLVASAQLTVRAAGITRVKLILTGPGRAGLNSSQKVTLVATGSFAVAHHRTASATRSLPLSR